MGFNRAFYFWKQQCYQPLAVIAIPYTVRYVSPPFGQYPAFASNVVLDVACCSKFAASDIL
jgi:hypothetical protein